MSLNLIARHRMCCRKTRRLMSGYLDGEPGPERHRAVAGHLDRYPECGRMAHGLSRTIDALHLLGRGGAPAARPGPVRTEPIA